MTKYECENCGVMTDMLVGGECIKKCSSVVPQHELKELVGRWKRASYPTDECWKELEEVIDNYE